jgi:hypothetical protein
MKVNCLVCGHNVDLDDVYSDYEGMIRCFVCSTLLEIKTEDGQIKSVRFARAMGGARGAAENGDQEG